MKLNMQPYQSPDEYWQMRQSLREVMLRNNFREFSWHVIRTSHHFKLV